MPPKIPGSGAEPQQPISRFLHGHRDLDLDAASFHNASYEARSLFIGGRGRADCAVVPVLESGPKLVTE
jgi:hypothetical protein